MVQRNEKTGVAVIGLDFGKRIGCSFLINGKVVDLSVHTRTSDAVKWINNLISRYKPQRAVVKLGSKYLNRFLRALSRFGGLPVEVSLVIVDEYGTTKAGKRAGIKRHEISALNIALMAGELRSKRRNNPPQRSGV